ncbi:MAG: phage holin family protein [Akkermansia sp.]
MNWFGIPERLAAAREAGAAAANGARETAAEALQHAEALVALLRAELAVYAAQQAKRMALRVVAVACLLVAYLGLCVLAVLLLAPVMGWAPAVGCAVLVHALVAAVALFSAARLRPGHPAPMTMEELRNDLQCLKMMLKDGAKH